MSKTVEERVLEMQFDNKNFESNVKQSMNTLDRLKAALKMNKQSDGMDKLGRSVKNVKMDPLAKSVDKVKASFSALDVVAMTALSNITNSAVNAGKKMVKALTLDPIISGFQEYETKINAVQTILANTSKDGMTMQDVTSVLDDLNHYADKTIYNFTEMTRNIGTFTAAGVKLYDAAGAIKGIANLAAVSGSNSQQASTAMYQLSQALAAGTVKLQDWNSVVNAGMGGTKFQEALKQTARDMGIAVDDLIAQQGSFRESLREGWMTADVLNQTLKNFTVEGAAEYAASMVSMGKYTQEQADALMREAQIAEDAATKVKTFTQLWDVMKEATQSGWAETWEVIIGDFEEAKEFLTPIADLMQAVIGESANARNSVLRAGLQSSWKELSADVRACGIDVNEFQEKLIAAGETHGVVTSEMVTEAGGFATSLKEGWLSADIFAEVMRSYSSAAKEFNVSTEDMQAQLTDFQNTVKEVWASDIPTQQGKLRELAAAGYDYNAAQELITKTLNGESIALEDLSVSQMQALGFTQDQILALQDMAGEAETAGSALNNLIQDLSKPSGRELILEGISNMLMTVIDIMDVAKQAWREVFPPLEGSRIYAWMEAFRNLTEKLMLTSEGAEDLKNTLRGVFSIFHMISQIIMVPMKVALELLFDALGHVYLPILKVTGSIGNLIYAFDQAVFASGRFEAAVRVLPNTLRAVGRQLELWFEEFMALPQVQAFTDEIKNRLNVVLEELKTRFVDGSEAMARFVRRVKAMGTIHLSDLPDILADFKQNVLGSVIDFDKVGKILKESFTKTVAQLKEFGVNMANVFKSIGSVFKRIGHALKNVIKDNFDLTDITSLLATGAGFTAILAFKKVIELLEGPMNALENISKGIEKNLKAKAFKTTADGIKSLATALLELSIALTLLSKIKWEDLGKASLVLVGLGAALVGMAAAMKKISAGSEGQNVLNGGAILAFGTAILFLAKALKDISAIDVQTLGPSVVALIGIMGSLVASMRLLTYGGVTALASGSLTLLSFAATIRILVGSLKQLNKIDAKDLPKTVTLLVASMLTLSKLANIGAGMNWLNGIGLVGLVTSIKLLVSLVNDLSKIEPEDALKAAIGLIPTIAALRAIIKSVGAMATGPGIVKAGATIALISGSLLLIAHAMKAMASLAGINCMAGAVAITMFLTSFALILKASQKMSKYIMRAGATFLLMAGAISSLALVIALLSKLDPSGLGRATAAIVALEGAFIGLVAVSKYATANKGTIIALAGAVTALTASVVALGMLDPAALARATLAVDSVVGTFAALMYASKFATTSKAAVASMIGIAAALSTLLYLLTELPIDSTMQASASLSLLMGVLAVSFAVMAKAGAVAPKAIGAMYAMTGVVGLLATMLAIMGEMDVEGSIKTATSISILLGAMTAVTAAAAGIGKLGGAALAAQGALAIDAVVSIVGGFMVAIGALATYIPQVEEFLDKGIVVLNKVASGLGQFIGNIIGGIAEGATSHLGGIADNLSDFLQRLEPFLKAASKIDPDIATGISALSSALLKLTAADFLHGIMNFLSGGDAITDFAEKLLPLGEALAEFANSTKNVDAGQLNNISEACLKLAEMAKALPTSGGLKGAIAGSRDMTAFIKDLQPLADALVKFNETISNANIDVGKLNQVVQAATQLAQLAATLPSTGGFMQNITGVKDLAAFAKQLTKFGKAISDFSSETGDINVARVNSVAEAADGLVELATKLPKMDGLFQAFSGKQDLGQFGNNLVDLGKGLSKFSESVTGTINTESVAAAVNSAEMLVKLAEGLPEPGFFSLQWDFRQFANQLAPLGEGISAFASSVSGIDNVDSVKDCVTVAESISALANGLPEGGAMSKLTTLSDFGMQLRNFGVDFEQFYYSVSELEPDKLVPIVDMMNTIGLLADSIASVPTENYGQFADMIGSIVEADFTGAADNLDVFKTALQNFAYVLTSVDYDGIDQAVESITPVIELSNSIKEAELGGQNGLREFGGQLKSFGKSLAKFNEATADVDLDQVDNAVKAAEKVSDIAIKVQGVDMTSFTNFMDSAKDLKKVGKAIKGFYDYTGDIDATRLNALVRIVDGLGDTSVALKEVDVDTLKDNIQALKDIGDTDFSGVQKNMGTFSRAMVVMSNAFENIDPETVSKTTEAVNGLKDIVEAMPPKEDVQKKLQIGDLAKDLPRFGETLAEFSKQVSGKVNLDEVGNAMTALNRIVGLVKVMPDSNTVAENMFGGGRMSISEMMSQLTSVGTNLALFSKDVDGTVNVKAIGNAMTALNRIVAIAKVMPDSNTALENIFGGGRMSMNEFVGQMTNLGEGLASFSGEVSGNVSVEEVSKAMDALKQIVDVAKLMPDSNTTIEAIFGGGRMSMNEFAGQMSNLGEGLANFSAAVDGKINVEAVGSAMTALNRIVGVAKVMPETSTLTETLFGGGRMSMNQFATEMDGLGTAIADFSAAVDGKVSVEAVGNAMTAFNRIVGVAKVMPESNTFIEDLFGGGRMGMNTLATQLSGLGTSLADFSAAVDGKVSLEAIGTAMDAMTKIVDVVKIMPQVNNILGSIATGTRTMTLSEVAAQMSGVGEALSTMSSELTGEGKGVDVGAITNAMTALRAIVDVIKILPDVDNALGAAAKGYSRMKLSDLGSEMEGLGTALSTLSTDLANVELGNIEQAATATQSLIDLVKSLGTGMGGVSVTQSANDIKAVGAALKDLDDNVSGIDPISLGNLGTGFANLTKGITGNDIGSLAESLIKFAQGMADVAAVKISNIATEIENGAAAIDAAFETLRTSFETGWSDAVSVTGGGISNSIRTELQAAVKTINSEETAFNAAGKNLIQKLQNGVEAKFKTLKTTMGSLAESCATAIGKKRQSFYTAGSNLIAGVISGMSVKASEARAKAISIANDISNAFNNALKIQSPSRVMMKSGKYIVEGIAKGMTDNSNLGKSAAVNSAKTIINAFKEELKIHSPSIVGRDEVGKFIIEGIAEGIKEETAAEKAMREKAEELERQATQMAENIRTAFQKEIDKIDYHYSLNSTLQDVWEARYPNANERDRNTAFVTNMSTLVQELGKKVEYLRGEMDVMADHFGKDSEQYRQAQDDWLAATKEWLDLKNQINTALTAIRDYSRESQLAEFNQLSDQLDLQYQLQSLLIDEEDTQAQNALSIQKTNGQLSIMSSQLKVLQGQLRSIEIEFGKDSDRYREAQKNILQMQIQIAQGAKDMRSTMKAANQEIEDYNQKIKDTKQSYVDKWMSMVDQVDSLKNMGYTLKQIDEAIRNSTGWADQVPKQMAYTIQSTADIVSQAIGGGMTSYSKYVGTTMGKAVEDFANTGKGFVIGVSQGMSSQSSKISNASISTAQKAVTAIQPIKQEFNNNGTQIGNALAVGITKSSPKVESSAERLNKIFEELGNGIRVTMDGIVMEVNNSLKEMANAMDEFQLQQEEVQLPNGNGTLLQNTKIDNHMLLENQRLLYSISDKNERQKLKDYMNSLPLGTVVQKQGDTYVTNNTFYQTNNSPSSLSTADIARNTQTMFNSASGGGSSGSKSSGSSKVSNAMNDAKKIATSVATGLLFGGFKPTVKNLTSGTKIRL